MGIRSGRSCNLIRKIVIMIHMRCGDGHESTALSRDNLVARLADSPNLPPVTRRVELGDDPDTKILAEKIIFLGSSSSDKHFHPQIHIHFAICFKAPVYSLTVQYTDTLCLLAV